jgi:hypothetical protein
VSDVVVPSPLDVCELWLNRVRSALDDCGSPVEDAYVAAGAVAWDTCCGLLVAAPERVYRSAFFPNEGATDDECETGLLVVDVVVLLLRCVPTVDSRGNPPPIDALSRAYGEVLSEAAVVWNAVTSELPEGWDRARVDQQFVGAQGGCIGVETRFTIGLPQEEWCIDCEAEGLR